MMPSPETVTNNWQMCCPKCGRDDQIDVQVKVFVRLTPDGSDPFAADMGDHEWEDDSPAECGSCGYEGLVRDFEIKEGE